MKNLVISFFKLYWLIIKMPIIWFFRGLKWIIETFKNRKSDIKDLTKLETQEVIHILDNENLKEQLEDGSDMLPSFAKDKDGNVLIGILNTQKIEDFDKVLRGFGEVFNKDYISYEHVKNNVYRLQENLLPDRVDYLPSNSSDMILGVDYLGNEVSVNMGHSPVMLITGASGSGKSVLGRVVTEEATRLNYDVFVVDGKGGIDWMDAPKKALLVDLKEIAEHYENLVVSMNEKLKELVSIRAKNWMEANEKGHDWKPSLTLMDESSDFFVPVPKTQDKEKNALQWRIINACSELARKSRAVGIYQVFSLQAAQSDAIPQDIKNNSGFRVSYALPTAAMSQVLFESSIAYDSSLRMGKGVFKGVEGSPVVFRGAYVG